MTSLRKAELGRSYFVLTLLRVAFWPLVPLVFIVAVRLMSPKEPPRELGYAELAAQIDNHNIVHPRFVELPDRAIVTGELRNSSAEFSSPVPDGPIESLAKHLGNPRLATNIAKELPHGSLVYWGTSGFVVVFATIFFLLNFLIARFKRRLLELRTKEA